jgi:hypothetical protein
LTRFPPEIIKASIRPGSVYYFREESLKSTERHYFVVINRNPRTDEVILLVCASSQIARVRQINKHSPVKTLVIIKPEEYSGFRIPSIFNCNTVFRKSVELIMKKYNDKDLLVKPDMDLKLVDKLRNGVLVSNQIAPYIKLMLRE